MSAPTHTGVGFATITVVERHHADDDEAPEVNGYPVFSLLCVEFENLDAADFMEYIQKYPKAIQVYELS